MNAGHDILITFSGAMVFGVLFSLLARKLKISSIVILLLGGILVGPQFCGWVNPHSLGHGLKAIISLAVGIILFEGGLTLDSKGYQLVSAEIKGVLTKGVLITWLTSSAMIKYLFSFPWDFSLLAGSLIIVTGPTVIGPLLKRIRIKSKIQQILHWESVLIDPIGVFISLLCYEWIIDPGDQQPIVEFIKRVMVGIILGLSSGYFIHNIIKRRLIPEENINITFLASAVGIFTLSDLVSHESGLLSVTIAGFVIGYLQKGKIDRVKIYKAEFIQLLIGLLFILLSANLDLRSFVSFGLNGLVIVLLIMFLVRPLNIFLSTTSSRLSIKEKLFLSWVAPRGIVAASMASLFTLNLKEMGVAQAAFLETFTYTVIMGTVLFQGITANWVGRFLGVLEAKPKGWLIIGAHRLGRTVASFIEECNTKVLLVDTNARSIAQSRKASLPTIHGNALSLDIEIHPEIYGIGNVLAITENEDLNTLICQRWRKEIPGAKAFKWGNRIDSQDQEIGNRFAGGKLIWNNLKLDHICTMDLDEENSGMVNLKTRVENVTHGERVLVCAYKNKILPYLPKNETGECSLLTYLPMAVRPTLNIRKDWILISGSNSLADVTKELLERVQCDFPNLNAKELYKKLVDYEEKFIGMVCPETALPHCYTNDLNESVVLFAKFKKPIKSIHSDETISIVFLVLSPENQPRKHLNTLSDIAKFIMDEEIRSNLLNSNSQKELRKILLPSIDQKS